MKGDTTLDASQLMFRRYDGCRSCCKLIDSLKYAFERSAMQLKPLLNSQRPARFPNLRMERFDIQEDEAETSDESDSETVPRRCSQDSVALPSVPQQMEFFTVRVLLLLWFALLPIAVVAGWVRASRNGQYLDEMLFHPAIALLGLLPFNVLILRRILAPIAHAVLAVRLQWLEKQPNQSIAEDVQPPAVSTSEVFRQWRSALRVGYGEGQSLCFSRCPFEILGTATVVALLDCDGILTDLVPVPELVLVVNPNEFKNYNDNSEDEDSAVDDECIREQKQRHRAKNRRDRLQADRFTQLELHRATERGVAVQFLDERQKISKSSNLNPLALCSLLHSIYATSTRVDPASAVVRFLDNTIIWGRCLHWLSKAVGFDDTVACQYLLLRRVVMLRTRRTAGLRPQQVSGLLFLHSNQLHLFTLGTLQISLDACTTFWNGTAIEEFEEEDKRELLNVGVHTWQKQMHVETVTLCHRVLPERYRRYLIPETAAHSPHIVVEDIYVNDNPIAHHTHRGSQAQGFPSPVTSMEREEPNPPKRRTRKRSTSSGPRSRPLVPEKAVIRRCHSSDDVDLRGVSPLGEGSALSHARCGRVSVA